MATAAAHFRPGCAASRRGVVLRAAMVFCLAVLAVLPGCGGCRWWSPKPPADPEKADAELRQRLRKLEKKPDFEFGFRWRRVSEDPEQEGEIIEGVLAAAQPHEAKPPQSCPVKPGHWTLVTMPAKANNFAVLGELQTSVVDARGSALPLTEMPFTMTAFRPAALQKGQPKRLDVVIYVPEGRSTRPQLAARLSVQKGGRGGLVGSDVLDPMPAYQYHLAVLARSPELYGYLKDLDVVKSPQDPGGLSSSSRGYYRVCLLEPGRRVALPAHGLFWTGIACLLWDDADPDRLTLDQQLALLDWLHWGGQLIVSGPDTLDALSGSFLEPYLPVAAPATRQLTAADLDELNRCWTVPERVKGPRPPQRPQGERPGLPLEPLRPWTAVSWQLHPDARDVPGTGGLLAERCVGRGRVVVSAFRLGQRELVTWPSRHSFFNGCLLRRPPRVFAELEGAMVPTVSWSTMKSRQLDPLLVTGVRYFNRDHGRPPTTHQPQTADDWQMISGETVDWGSAAGGWDDFSQVAGSARRALTTAGQIEIPERTFVVWVAGAYLLVLVPLNWAFFRLIGRVEWAWAAAPAIALLCTGTVIRMARLDIGFARALTEIDVVELHGDYCRAHVTRYMAMYTSLATGYEIRSDDPGAQIQPFPENEPGRRSEDRFGSTELRYHYGAGSSLRGLKILSNSADMVHTEQMLDLGGAVSLVHSDAGHRQVVNGTEYTIRDAGVMRKLEDGALEAAWLGTLEPGALAAVRFQPVLPPAVGQSLWQEQRNRLPVTAAGAGEGQLSLRQLCQLAEDTSALQRGDARLVGRLDEALPGMEILPAAPQTQRAALVLVHLRFGFGADPERDRNLLSDVDQGF